MTTTTTTTLAIIAAGLLSACSMVPADSPGRVVAFNGSSVTIEGGFAMYGDPPPPPIQAHADQICKGRAAFQGIAQGRSTNTGSSFLNAANAGFTDFFFICNAG